MTNYAEFNKLYLLALSGKTCNTMYKTGLSVVREQDNYRIRDDVLTKLLVLYPNDETLLYYMGCIHLPKSTTKSLMWFKQCLSRNPKHVDCLLDYLKLLFDNDMFDAIAQHYDILYQIPDNRIRLVVAAYEGKRRKFELSIQLYLKIIDSGEKDATTLFMCYSNVGITYNDIDERTKSVGYLQKAIAMIDSHCIDNVPLRVYKNT